jgi:hypothetical protein
MISEDSTLTQLFVKKADTEEGCSKLAAGVEPFIRDRLRELSFIDKLIPVQPITPAECQISTKHDTLVKIIFVEPKSSGMVVNFRANTEAEIIRAGKAEGPFFPIMSKRFEKTEEELLSYPFGIFKVIEDNVVKDLHEVKDLVGIQHIESCVQAEQYDKNGSAYVKLNATNYATYVKYSVVKGQQAQASETDDFVVYPILKDDLKALFNLIDGRFLKTEVILIGETDFNSVLTWTIADFGDKVASEVVVSGYKYSTLLGMKYVRTIKTNILRPGNVYSMTDPKFAGVNYVLQSVKFFLKKEVNVLSMQAWYDTGMGFINVAAFAKCELYAGSVVPSQTDSGYAAAIPVDESELGAVNNLVDKGFYYPHVHQY